MIKLHNTNNLNITKVVLISKDDLDSRPQSEMLTGLGFEAKYKQIQLLPEQNIIFIGLNQKPLKTIDPYYKVDFYEIGAVLGNTIKKTKIKDVQLESSSVELDSKNIQDFALGLSNSLWCFDKYKAKDENDLNTHQRLFLANSLAQLITQEDLKTFDALQSGVELTREIIDDTPQAINPSTIQSIIESELGQFQSIDLKFYNDQELEEMGMDGVNFVGKGSVNKPVMVHAVYKPNSTVTKKICLVGKGVTYDSGGLDIKTGGHMKTMKCDMGGAATIFGLFKTLSILNLDNVEVHWISPFLENMIDGNSYKPDDIITSYSGQTIEVIDTDAEGRLTLADALSYATTIDPDYIIDLATLTGACIYSISDYYTAIMSNDQWLQESLTHSYQENLEYAKPVTLSTVLTETIEGDISDLRNLSKYKMTGHITAGLFLSKFIDQDQFRNDTLQISEPKTYSWAHLDIAGSSYNEGKNKIGANGSTGHGIRSLWTWLNSLQNN